MAFVTLTAVMITKVIPFPFKINQQKLHTINDVEVNLYKHHNEKTKDALKIAIGIGNQNKYLYMEAAVNGSTSSFSN